METEPWDLAVDSGEEASWAAGMTIHAGNSCVEIAMANRGMSDLDMERWCSWCRDRLRCALEASTQPIVATEVDFAGNNLGASGVRQLLTMLREARVAVHVLKLHHNRLETAGPVAEHLLHCDGSLRELHLSHNALDAASAAEIVLSAASARLSEDGTYAYPRVFNKAAGHASPLWLRLEQNCIDAARLQQLLPPRLAALGRRCEALCCAGGRSCMPKWCGRYQDPPVVHAKHLWNQRVWPFQPSSCKSEGSVQEQGDDGEMSPGAIPQEGEVLTWRAKQAAQDEATAAECEKESLQYSRELLLMMRQLMADAHQLPTEGRACNSVSYPIGSPCDDFQESPSHWPSVPCSITTTSGGEFGGCCLGTSPIVFPSKGPAPIVPARAVPQETIDPFDIALPRFALNPRAVEFVPHFAPLADNELLPPSPSDELKEKRRAPESANTSAGGGDRESEEEDEDDDDALLIAQATSAHTEEYGGLCASSSLEPAADVEHLVFDHRDLQQLMLLQQHQQDVW